MDSDTKIEKQRESSLAPSHLARVMILFLARTRARHCSTLHGLLDDPTILSFGCSGFHFFLGRGSLFTFHCPGPTRLSSPCPRSATGRNSKRCPVEDLLRKARSKVHQDLAPLIFRVSRGYQ